MSFDSQIKTDLELIQTRVGQLLDASGKNVVDQKVYKDLDAKISSMLKMDEYREIFSSLKEIQTNLLTLIDSKLTEGVQVTSEDLEIVNGQINEIRNKIFGSSIKPEALSTAAPASVTSRASQAETKSSAAISDVTTSIREEPTMQEKVLITILKELTTTKPGLLVPANVQETLKKIDKLPSSDARIDAYVHFINTDKTCQGTKYFQITNFDAKALQNLNIQLPNLLRLGIFHSGLTSIPKFVFTSPNLEILILNMNHITSDSLMNQVPEIISRLPHLFSLGVNGNPAAGAIPDPLQRHLDKNRTERRPR